MRRLATVALAFGGLVSVDVACNAFDASSEGASDGGSSDDSAVALDAGSLAPDAESTDPVTLVDASIPSEGGCTTLEFTEGFEDLNFAGRGFLTTSTSGATFGLESSLDGSVGRSLRIGTPAKEKAFLMRSGCQAALPLQCTFSVRFDSTIETALFDVIGRRSGRPIVYRVKRGEILVIEDNDASSPVRGAWSGAPFAVGAFHRVAVDIEERSFRATVDGVATASIAMDSPGFATDTMVIGALYRSSAGSASTIWVDEASCRKP